MKILTTLLASLLIAGSAYAGCPSKTINGKFSSFDPDSKMIHLTNGKKVKVSSTTKMVGFDCPTGLSKGDKMAVHGCNCSNKTAKKIAKVVPKEDKKES